MLKILYSSLLILFFCFNLFSASYQLQWNGEYKYSQTIKYPDKSIYKILNSYGFWEDNNGYFGKLNCIGWAKNINQRESLEVSCEAIDNEEEKFWLILKRDSEIGAGTGSANYIAGTGKYIELIGKICKYAINYSQGGFFYKQICK